MPRILTAVLLLALGATAQAGTMRCGTALINEGDPMDEVLAKCGQPDTREVVPPYPSRRGPDGKFIPGGPQIEIWTYGPRNGAIRHLRFREGTLDLINITRG